MTRELSPEHQAVADEALARIARLSALALGNPGHIPGEPVDEGTEAK